MSGAHVKRGILYPTKDLAELSKNPSGNESHTVGVLSKVNEAGTKSYTTVKAIMDGTGLPTVSQF